LIVCGGLEEVDSALQPPEKLNKKEEGSERVEGHFLSSLVNSRDLPIFPIWEVSLLYLFLGGAQRFL